VINHQFEIKLGQLLKSLSYALDIAENRYYGHSRRTAYIAYSIAAEMELTEEVLTDVYYASLIHDIGMAGFLSNYSVIDIHYDEDLKKKHCDIGYRILDKLPFNGKVREYILYHHEDWQGNGPYKLRGDEVPLGAQIIHIADYFELFFVRKYDEIHENYDINIIKKWIDVYRGKMFKDELCDVILEVIKKDKFYLDLKPENINQALDIIEPSKNTNINIHGLHNISEAFSILIDNKSRFTYEHSQGISQITSNFATYLGYNPLMIEKLTIAANLHDIGKFVIPSSILEKPGKLTSKEFMVIKSHAYYTKLILKQVDGLEDIAEWAGNHHEKLNGEGYPERLDERTLTIEDQIIAFADIYQALTEHRPYRSGMEPKKAIAIMMNMAEEGYILKDLLPDFKQLVL
jgi:HD-GYP domain-containing protein (c-di-GMP phosphodiesterase class II)